MFAIKNTTFLTCIVICGAMVCFAAYHSTSTPVGSSQLSERQLAGIYGGRSDCTETEYVEGCATEGNNAHFVPADKPKEWDPPVREEGETTEAFSQRYLDSRPDCGDDIETVVYGGTSATGGDAEPIEGDSGQVVCTKIWPITRSSVQEKAKIKTEDVMEVGGETVAFTITDPTECVTNDDYETHCVVCQVGAETPGDPRQKYKCPDGE